MPSPGALAPPRLPVEDSYLELLADSLEGLELSARGQFLQRYLQAVTHLELSESQSLQVWDEMLVRRRDLTSQGIRPVSLKAALMDVLATSGLLRVPIIIEYEDLKKLELNAVTDPLTGLYNRRLFDETFEKELNRSRRYGQPLGLVILDLHRFKEVNDKHGHPRGDEVLRATAATLKRALRNSDSAFRTGGDEFALLLPQTDASQALALSRRVETVFAEMLQPLELSVSVGMDHGIAVFPQDADQAEQLIRVADERLYQQKHKSHGRVSEAPASAEVKEVATEAKPPAESPAVAAKPAPIETSVVAEKPETPVEAVVSVASESISHNGTDAPRIFAKQRKAERVSMTGTNAYAVLGEQSTKRARVLDLGFGGVALELDAPEELPESVFAVLHVPILPPVRVNLRPVWKQKTIQGSLRIGCAFVS